MLDFSKLPQFKCHASAAGKIMTNDRSGKAMGQTCKSYLQEWMIEQATGIRRDIDSKYSIKGTLVEADAIELLGRHHGWIGVEKNSITYEDDFFIGTPDIVLPALISDNKSPWDVFTFPWFEDTCPEKDYPQQLQVYMHLTAVKKAQVDYTLMPTPEDVPQWWTSSIPEDLEQWPTSKRVKTYGTFDYDPDYISALQQRVIECREYIKLLIGASQK